MYIFMAPAQCQVWAKLNLGKWLHHVSDGRAVDTLCTFICNIKLPAICDHFSWQKEWAYTAGTTVYYTVSKRAH